MRINSLLMASAAGVLFLSACVPQQPYDPNDPQKNARQNAITGATLGAIAGVLTGDGGKDKLDRAAAGAVIGGLAGGVYGAALDKQAAELSRDISDRRVQIINEGNQLRVVMPEGILFPVDSAAVQPGIMGDLNTVAQSLNRYPGTRVEVVGHTDNTGTAAYNQDLSQRRASAVGTVLARAGVAPNRIAAYGRGEDMPVASNLSEAGRAQNRRVEILIIPIQ